jgi:chromosomal replication initiator protein
LGHIFAVADGTDMLDCVTEIPLPGRIFAPPGVGGARRAATNQLPAFVAGPENQLVAGTINGLLHFDSPADRDAKKLVPPLLVFCGPSGTGKSHLAFGLVRHWQSRHGEASAVYTTAADFRHQLNDAVKRQAELEFRNQFRGRGLLAIDDLQHLPLQEFALQELRYTLDDYEDRDATVIVTSSQPPSTLPNLPPDLRSRLAGGLTLQLSPPGEQARACFIRQAATALGQPISEEAAMRLAHGIDGSANQLLSALFKMFAEREVGDKTELQRATQIVSERSANRPALREIIAVVARHQNIPQTQLKSSSRRQSVVYARNLVVYLAREIAAATYDEIGKALGGRDHTTVLHSYRKLADERQHNPQTQETIDQLQRILLCR